MENNFEILGIVLEKLGIKKISDKTIKEDYLIEFGKEDKNGKKSIAVISIFSFNKKYLEIQNIKEGEEYIFTLAIDGRQLSNGKYINNLKVINIKNK